MSHPERAMELISKGISNPKKVRPYIMNRVLPDLSSVKYGIGYTTTEFDTKVGVVNVKIRKHSYYSKRAPEEYEPQVVSQLRELLNSDSVFYDIGSYFGYHIKIAQLCGVLSSRIHAFEGDRSHALLLKQNCLNRDIHINNIFVGGKGEGDNVVTIDEYTNRNESPDVIKIDTQGAEYKIIQGARETLQEHSPSLLIEVHPGTEWDDSDIIGLLHSKGYAVGTVYHQMLRTDAERDINWLSREHNEPILEGERKDQGENPYLLVATTEREEE